MKYPAILKLGNGTDVLAIKNMCGIALSYYKDEYEETFVNKYYEDFNGFDEAKNITREYLNNHAIKIESQEHLDFLYEIAEGHELNLEPVECRIFDADYPYFVTVRSSVFHGNDKLLELHEKKLITIPLPPKEPEAKPWPQVGDEVLTASRQTARVLAINLNEAWVRYSKRNSEDAATKSYNTVAIATLTKPLTLEEELEEKLANKITQLENFDITGEKALVLAKAINNGQIKYLRYQPE